MEPSAFVPSLIWVAPFACLLLGIAIIPLAAPHFWESNTRKLLVSAVLGLPVLGLYLAHDTEALLHTGRDYVSFMILLGSLFVISGGVLMDGDLEATPRVNTLFLAPRRGLRLGHRHDRRVDAVHSPAAAHKRGASLRRAHGRVLHFSRVQHRRVPDAARRSATLSRLPAGVPFTWTLRLAPMWISDDGHCCLLIYFIWDTRLHRRETARPPEARSRRDIKPLRLVGTGESRAASLASSPPPRFLPHPGERSRWSTLATDFMAANVESTSITRITSRFDPILEVAVIFLGIFMTMIPALDILRARGAELGVNHAVAVFLGDRRALVVSRQRPDVSHLPRPRSGTAPHARGGRRAAHDPRGHQRRRRVHGRKLLHREWTQFHGPLHRRKPRHKDAEFWRLHAVQWRDLDPGVRAGHPGVFQRVTAAQALGFGL